MFGIEQCLFNFKCLIKSIYCNKKHKPQGMFQLHLHCVPQQQPQSKPSMTDTLKVFKQLAGKSLEVGITTRSLLNSPLSIHRKTKVAPTINKGSWLKVPIAKPL